jgi:Tfp pilus assembly protein FimV
MSWIDHQSQNPLIIQRKPAAGTLDSVVEDACIEPAFLTTYKGKLHLDTRGWVEEAKAYYAHAIARNPNDLLTHVQRVSLYAETADPAILGALLDLFLVLGDKGAPLLRRMLALARPILSSHDYHALHQQLEHGEEHLLSLQSHASSAVLQRGISGVTQLIHKGDMAQPAAADPLETARQQIDIGQIELAQETLETALLADPARLALHLALLEIYRHARDRQRVGRLWRELQGRVNPARAEWQRLLTQLKEEEQKA